MTRTCPHCGETLPPDPAQVRAHRRHGASPGKKAYDRDYRRGQGHARRGLPPEAPRTTHDYNRAAYESGHAAGTARRESSR